MRAAIFLDRDGTLNHCFSGDGTTHPPATLAELALVDGVEDACARLRQAGYLLLVVTNQPDVRRGSQTAYRVEEINDHLVRTLHLDDVAGCYHDDRDGCECRKPKPGLILELADRHGVDLSRSFMVGDRGTDITAGRSAGCRTILVSDSEPDCGQDHRRPSLAAAADLILRSTASLASHPHRTHQRTNMTTGLGDLNVKLFADGADLLGMKKLYVDPLIRGFTTNPTLMCRAGVLDYETFAQEVLEAIPDRPVSFEVLSDDLDTMAEQARVIGSWSDSVYVKIPITNTSGEPTLRVVRELNDDGIKLNVTAIATLEQVVAVAPCLGSGTPAIVSVFAGRIADTGRDPMPIMAAAVSVLAPLPTVELLWASPRELLNIFQADQVGCDIITATADVLAKRHLIGKDLATYSLETVRMFFEDSRDLEITVPGALPVTTRRG